MQGDDTFGGDAAFQGYMLRAYGADRRSVNILMALGISTWGWMMIVPYYMLGRARRGLTFASAFLLGCMVSARHPAPSPVRFAPLAVFAIAWVDLNMLLARYAAMARARIQRLDSAAEADAGHALEKGLLLYKALGDRAGAAGAFKNALGMGGGAAILWNLAGISLCRLGAYEEALQAFERGSDPPRRLARTVRAHRMKAERMKAMGGV